LKERFVSKFIIIMTAGDLFYKESFLLVGSTYIAKVCKKPGMGMRAWQER